LDTDLLLRLVQIVSAIANVGPDGPGFLYLGIADKEEDVAKIESLDKVTPMRVGQRYVVGIEREVSILKIKMEDYIQKIIGAIRSSALSEPLKTQVLARIDVVNYRGHTVVRLMVPAQVEVAFVGNDCFVRQNSGTVKVEGKGLLALNALFKK
jgi:hypothetical protein